MSTSGHNSSQPRPCTLLGWPRHIEVAPSSSNTPPPGSAFGLSVSTASKYSPTFVAMGEFSTERDGAIVVLTIDNQRVGNAISREAAAAIADVFDELSNGSGDVRAVLLRAEGKQF